jgi:hypothetical protein
MINSFLIFLEWSFACWTERLLSYPDAYVLNRRNCKDADYPGWLRVVSLNMKIRLVNKGA